MSYLLAKGDDWKQALSGKPPMARRKVRMLKAHTVAPFLEDYAFFTFAPLYVHSGVGYSIPDQFEEEAGEQDRIVLDYQREVIGGLGRWGQFVEGIQRAAWEDFCHYASTLMFYSVQKQLVWRARHHDLNVERPDAKIVVEPGQAVVSLRVFLPDGNRGRMCIKGGLPAKLWWDKPHPNMTDAAKAILACHGRIA